MLERATAGRAQWSNLSEEVGGDLGVGGWGMTCAHYTLLLFNTSGLEKKNNNKKSSDSSLLPSIFLSPPAVESSFSC